MSTKPKVYPPNTSINTIVSDQLRRSRSALRWSKVKRLLAVTIVFILLFSYPVTVFIMWLSRAVR
jgi:hypothetical protein